MSEVDLCTLSEHHRPMQITTQGAALKAWRKKLGYTLEEAAELIAKEAEKAGVDKSERTVPRTHPALRRWEENENRSHNIKGLKIIAKAYGTTATAIQNLPENAEDERAVEAFRQVLRQK